METNSVFIKGIVLLLALFAIVDKVQTQVVPPPDPVPQTPNVTDDMLDTIQTWVDETNDRIGNIQQKLPGIIQSLSDASSNLASLLITAEVDLLEQRQQINEIVSASNQQENDTSKLFSDNVIWQTNFVVVLTAFENNPKLKNANPSDGRIISVEVSAANSSRPMQVIAPIDDSRFVVANSFSSRTLSKPRQFFPRIRLG